MGKLSWQTSARPDTQDLLFKYRRINLHLYCFGILESRVTMRRTMETLIYKHVVGALALVALGTRLRVHSYRYTFD